jgi:hypothetical protein
MTTMQVLTAAFGTRPFTLTQAAVAGVSQHAVRHAVAAGRLERIGPGVYIAARETEVAFIDRVRAAALAHPDAIVVGEAAAALHELWCPRPTGWRDVVLAAPRAHRTYARARLVHRRIEEADITIRDGIRCTAPARTALDIAATATLAEALVVIDSFGRLTEPTRRQALDPTFRNQVRDELLRTASRMRCVRGIDRARYAAALANPAAESAPESYARGLFIADGWPEPAVGSPIRGADGRTYYADLYWPDRRLIVEIDGTVKYQRRGDLIDEKRREDALRGAGHRVERVLAADLWRVGLPEAVTERRAS